MAMRIRVEGDSARATALRRLLGGEGPLSESLAGEGDAEQVLVVHEPPEHDAIRWLADDPGRSLGAAVVVVSPVRDPGIRVAALRAGATEVVVGDPPEPQALRAAIEAAAARFAHLRAVTGSPDPSAEDGAMARRVLDGLFAFVGLLTPDGTVLDANRAPLEAAGIRLEDVRGEKFWDTHWWRTSPETRERLREACARAARGEVVRYDAEVRLKGDATTIIDFQLAPLTDEAGVVTHLIPSAVDVSDRKRAELELRRSEERFRTMAEAAPSIAFVMGAEGRGGYANSRWEEYFGVGFEEAAERGWEGTIHPADEEHALAEWARCVASGEVFEMEYRLLRRDGAARWHLTRAVPVRDESGRVVAWCGTITDVHGLKEAQEELRRSSELLRTVTETVVDPLYAKDRAGRLLLANPATLRRLGLREEEVLGHTALESLGDTPRARAIMANDREVLRTGRTHEIAESLVTPEGERTFVSVKTPLRDASGAIVGLVGVSRDVTEEHRAAEALRESEARSKEAAARAEAERRLLDAVLEAAPAGIIVADAAGKLLRMNAANSRLWGRAPFSGGVEEYREWKGWWADESERRGRRLTPDEWAMARALRGETVRDDIVEIEPFDAPGVRRTVVNSAAPVRDAEGRIAGAVVAAMDITAWTAAEAARRESESRFRTLADNIAQLAWIADARGEVVWYNRRWLDYTGTTPASAEERAGWRSVLHPAHADRVTAKLLRHFVSGEPWEDTFPLRSASGEYRWFLSRMVPIRDASGKVTRWFGTGTDVTAQREAEERLREADRRKDEFIAVLAHELRNPLAPVGSAVELLRALAPDEARIRKARDVIERQVSHMARLVDDLLDVSRIARGKLALQKEDCDLAAIARQTAEDYRPSLESRGLTLAVADDGPVRVDGDPVRLAQMIGNLLQNAGRFSSAGDRVELRTRADPDADLASVRVVDTGMGIAKELLPRLFDPFSQAEQGLARSEGGLGLGLALTKGIAELHGGEVTAHSEGPGKGAAFELRIPLGRSREAARRARRAGPAVEGLRVVVIEDNPDAAEMIGELLSLRGHRVEVALDGAAGVEAARALDADAVISDLGLPGALDGYGVARTIRADPELGDTHLIALSGYADERARRRSLDAGFDRHLAKPADIAELEAALKAAGPG
jgi:PAS domain S-box-containing protein